MVRGLLPLFAALLIGGAARAADPGETRCGANGMVERYICFGTRCQWNPSYERCASTNRAPTCNVGDTKCGANGFVQRCQQYSGDPYWQATTQHCAADRDPADNAPPGYGGYRPAPAPAYSGSYSSDASESRICTPGQQECGDDRSIRRCVMQGGRPAWEAVAGSRCGQAPGMRY